MHDIDVLDRFEAPCRRPQALGFDGSRLWISSVADSHVYSLELSSGTVEDAGECPGKPWGLAVAADTLRVLCGETAEDLRMIRTFVPGVGFMGDPTPAPDDTGSQLSFDGKRLHVSQWYNKKLLRLAPGGGVERAYDLPYGIAAHAIVGGHAYVLGTDDEATADYRLTKLDLATGATQDVARVPFLARGLTHDGTRFWTAIREDHELLAFGLPA